MAIYVPKDKKLLNYPVNGVETSFYCGEDLDEVSLILIQFGKGAVTLQEAHSLMSRALVKDFFSTLNAHTQGDSNDN